MSTLDPRAFWTFFRQGLSKWDQTASPLPSQRFLVDAMVEGGQPARARRIVELGPGVGVMTKPLLARMRPDAKLYTIEIDQPIHDELVRTVRDHRLHAICGSAEHVKELLAEAGEGEKVDAVVSSLGMSLIPQDVRERIAESVAEVLTPNGVYVQFGYVHTRWLAYSTTRGWSGFDYHQFMRDRFHEVKRRAVPLNVPPAFVYESRRPR